MSGVRRERGWAVGALAVLVAVGAVGAGGCTSGQAGSGSGASGSTDAARTSIPTATKSSTSTTQPADSVTVVDGVGLAILQSRTDYAVRGLQLAISNPGGTAFTVESARFTSPRFSAPADWTPRSTAATEIPPDLTRHLPVSLGEAVCPAPADADATLVVTVTDASGTRREVSGTPADPFGVLDRIAAEDCFDDMVAGVARLSIAGITIDGSDSDAVARISLAIDPREVSKALTVQMVRSTILLAPVAEGPDADQDWPVDVTIDGGDDPVTVELAARPARCDPHAVAEDKRGTVLPVEIAIEDGASGTVSLAPTEEQKKTLFDWIAARCGFAPTG
jgi:hypothetical protein